MSAHAHSNTAIEIATIERRVFCNIISPRSQLLSVANHCSLLKTRLPYTPTKALLMTQAAHPEGLSMLDKRKIEAEILKEVYETLKASHGEEVARKTISESVRRSAIEQARQFAAAAPGGPSLKAFQDVMPLWTKGGALEIEVKEQTDTTFTFNVTRCQYAETYKAMGLGEIGALLSCNRDGAFCEGYDPKLKLERSQTIMGGASHCDFKYRYEE